MKRLPKHNAAEPFPKLLWVEWIDSTQTEAGWQEVGDAHKGPSKIVQVGFLVGEDADCFTLANSLGDWEEPENRQVEGTSTIVKGCIKKCRVMRRLK